MELRIQHEMKQLFQSFSNMWVNVLTLVTRDSLRLVPVCSQGKEVISTLKAGVTKDILG